VGGTAALAVAVTESVMRGGRRMRIAIDAMGGDNAPEAIVQGTLRVLREDPELETILVGVPKALYGLAEGGERIRVVASGPAIAEGAPPARSLLRQPDASVAVTMRLVAAGDADCAISFGNTGAALVSAVHEIGLLPGVTRCTVGETLFRFAPHRLILDLGPSVDVRAGHLVAFARLGCAYLQAFAGLERPRVGILSNGGENGKGNLLVKEATPLLAESGLNFIGAIEGHELVEDKADVIVCDGFVGNVLVKFCEGLADVLDAFWRAETGRRPPADRPWANFRTIEDRGAALLGVRRPVLLGHGRADGAGVAGVVRQAARLLRGDFQRRLEQTVAERWRDPDAAEDDAGEGGEVAAAGS
jgi:glycerol-3-phosphate acyltransferase PlsX